MTTASIFWGVLFGALGTGYCIYAKRQHAALPGICGVGLIVLPYLFTNTYLLVTACTVVAAIPYFFKA